MFGYGFGTKACKRKFGINEAERQFRSEQREMTVREGKGYYGGRRRLFQEPVAAAAFLGV